MEIHFWRGEHLNQWTLSNALHNVNWPYSISEGLKTDWPPLKKREFLQQIAFELKLQTFPWNSAYQSTLHVSDLPASSSVSQFLTWNCCRKGAPPPGPKSRLLSNMENCPRRHMLTKQETLLEKGTQAESSRVRESRRTVLPCGSWSQVFCWWD